MMSIEEMKHVMTRIGDTLSPEEATNFFSALDTYGDVYIRMDELLGSLLPQSNKEPYLKTVHNN